MSVKTTLLALFSTLSAFSQAGRLDGGFVTASGFGLYWETRLEPASPALAQNLGTAKMWAGGTFTRILMDRQRQAYFGYRVVVAGPPYRLTFMPLVLTTELAQVARIANPEGWKQLPVGVPEPQVVRFGDVIALDLMLNPDTGQKIVDYLTIQEPFQPTFNNTTPRQFSFVAGNPRDFRVEDVELRIREPRLSVNGKAESGREDVSSPTVWLYVPNKGRFTLSLTPRAGFLKAGEVRGTSLSFKVGADTFTVSSAVRIAPGDAPFNLYVLHEPAWRPADTSAFTMGQ